MFTKHEQFQVGSQISRVCNYLINKGISNDRPLSNISLQKLLYFAQGVYLANREDKVLFEEDFYAWKFGPVIESVYQEFKVFGNNAITPNNGGTNFESKYLSFYNQLSKDHKDCLDVTYSAFGKFSPFELVSLTHLKDSPWHQVYQIGVNKIIDKELIKEFFLKKYVKN